MKDQALSIKDWQHPDAPPVTFSVNETDYGLAIHGYKGALMHEDHTVATVRIDVWDNQLLLLYWDGQISYVNGDEPGKIMLVEDLAGARARKKETLGTNEQERFQQFLHELSALSNKFGIWLYGYDDGLNAYTDTMVPSEESRSGECHEHIVTIVRAEETGTYEIEKSFAGNENTW